MELSEEAELTILGLWRMRKGDYATITNKIGDIPEWTKDLGFYPEYPNFWRVDSGDRVVWVGRSRPGLISEGWASEAGILSILDLRRHAVAMLDLKDEYEEEFDALTFEEIKEQPELKNLRYCQIALKAVRELGIPKSLEHYNSHDFD